MYPGKKILRKPNDMGPSFLFKEYWHVVGDNNSIMKNVLSLSTIQLELLGFTKK